jgi:hypothetical protein
MGHNYKFAQARMAPTRGPRKKQLFDIIVEKSTTHQLIQLSTQSAQL